LKQVLISSKAVPQQSHMFLKTGYDISPVKWLALAYCNHCHW